jgi:hypothetical protein
MTAGPAPLEKNVAPAPPSEIDWAGPYIGFNVGAARTHFDVSHYVTGVDLEEQFYEAVETPGRFVSETSFEGSQPLTRCCKQSCLMRCAAR